MVKLNLNFKITDRKGTPIKDSDSELMANEVVAAILENPTEDIMKDPLKLLKRNKLVKGLYDGKIPQVESQEVESIEKAVSGSYLKLFISAQILEKIEELKEKAKKEE